MDWMFTLPILLYLVLNPLKTVFITENGLSPGALILDILLFLSVCSLVRGLPLTARSIVKSLTPAGNGAPKYPLSL